ncbi:Uma2 family endonuclease [Streptomyces sp. NPDC093109]|uniref:Uma2 family endonuclease n=1 Tax=Streptomyces sp. NPDC093109 TaxID=3154977 RepID=UPI00344D51F8
MAPLVPECEPEYVRLLNRLKGRIPALLPEEAFELFSAVAPAGWRVELLEDGIHAGPLADGAHAEIVSELCGQFHDHRQDPLLRTYTGVGLALSGPSPSANGRAMPGRAIPDLVIAPKGSFADELEFHDPAPVLLIAEVTSRSTGANDRGKKIRGYARAGIPVYLLVDREADQAILFTSPVGEEYRRKESYKLSEAVPLPAPFGFELDTGAF